MELPEDPGIKHRPHNGTPGVAAQYVFPGEVGGGVAPAEDITGHQKGARAGTTPPWVTCPSEVTARVTSGQQVNTSKMICPQERVQNKRCMSPRVICPQNCLALLTVVLTHKSSRLQWPPLRALSKPHAGVQLPDWLHALLPEAVKSLTGGVRAPGEAEWRPHRTHRAEARWSWPLVASPAAPARLPACLLRCTQHPPAESSQQGQSPVQSPTGAQGHCSPAACLQLGLGDSTAARQTDPVLRKS